MVKLLKPKEVSRLLNVTVRTLQNWDNDGSFKAIRNHKGRRQYTQDMVNNYLNNNIDTNNKQLNHVVIYARVSSGNQKDDLNNQIQYLKEYCLNKCYIVDDIVTDIGSGLNYKRKNWNTLLYNVLNGKISRIIISHKDRFIRFGFDWFNELCYNYGCEIEIVNNEQTSPEKELINDLISIIHVFSCRIYGLRKYKFIIKEEQLK